MNILDQISLQKQDNFMVYNKYIYVKVSHYEYNFHFNFRKKYRKAV